MTAPRHIGVHDARAHRFIGPRAATGRARSSQNARRHGLASAIGIDVERVKELSSALAGPSASPARRAHAFAAAYATIDLRRIWTLKSRLAAELLEAGHGLVHYLPHRATEIIERCLKELAAIARFESRALAHQRAALARLVVDEFRSMPLGNRSR